MCVNYFTCLVHFVFFTQPLSALPFLFSRFPPLLPSHFLFRHCVLTENRGSSPTRRRGGSTVQLSWKAGTRRITFIEGKISVSSVISSLLRHSYRRARRWSGLCICSRWWLSTLCTECLMQSCAPNGTRRVCCFQPIQLIILFSVLSQAKSL